MAQNIQGGLQRRSIIITTITIIMMSRQMYWRRPKRTWSFTNPGLMYHLTSHDFAGLFPFLLLFFCSHLAGYKVF